MKKETRYVVDDCYKDTPVVVPVMGEVGEKQVRIPGAPRSSGFRSRIKREEWYRKFHLTEDDAIRDYVQAAESRLKNARELVERREQDLNKAREWARGFF